MQSDSSHAGPERKAPLNFLFIMTDQQKADHVGFGGNPVLRTPNLDRLASRGMVFERAYVANPICMPNRASILTGRHPSVHGTRFNGIPLDRDAHTFVRVLREHGYRTGLVGKAHFQNIGDVPRKIRDSLPRDKDDAVRRDWPAGWDAYELQDRHRTEDVVLPPDWYGFDDVDLVVNHADYASGHYLRWLLQQGIDPDTMTGPRNPAEAAEEWWQVYKPQMSAELYPTSYIRGRSIAFLEQAAAASEPFILQCSFPDPHHPFTPPGEYWSRYDPDDVPLPASFADTHERSMPHMQRMIKSRGEQLGRMSSFAPTERQYRQAAAAEYGAIEMIDDAVGEMLATLERLGLADDTVVVFTSDHGDMFGEHGILLKGLMHYDGCVRVPLAMAGPGIKPGRTDALVSSLDFAQTILDLAGLPSYAGMQGEVLTPILSTGEGRVRDQLLIEEDEMFSLLFEPDVHSRMRTVVTDDARLTRWSGEKYGELFDLGSDPDEMDNLYGLDEASALQTEMHERLALQLMSAAETGRLARHRA